MKGILGRVEWSGVSPLSGSEKIIYFRHSPLCSEPSHWSLRAGSCSSIWLPQRDCDHIDKSFNMPYLPWLGGLSSDGFKSQVWVWSLKSLTHSHPEKLHLREKHESREKLGAWEGGDRGWDGWMPSQTQWAGAWARSRRQWRTGEPGVLQSTGSQRVGRDWVTEQQNGCSQGERDCTGYSGQQLCNVFLQFET